MISLHEGGGPRKRKPPEGSYQLHLKVLECRPLIWRRLAVRETMWLSRLHDAIQLAFDWYDYQTHVFSFGELRFGNPARQGELVVEDDRDVTLADLNLDAHGRFDYVYQFDQGWRVEVTVEGRHPLKRGVPHPRCTGGARAGPPEDCGGVEAYHDMLECIREPETALGREWLEWLGPGYDSEACDLAAINLALRKLRK
jgi:Plasmid pRiA4b ORF-3-like protein